MILISRQRLLWGRYLLNPFVLIRVVSFFHQNMIRWDAGYSKPDTQTLSCYLSIQFNVWNWILWICYLSFHSNFKYKGLWEKKLPKWCSGKEFTCQCSRCRFDPWVGKISWRRKWHPTPVFLAWKILWTEEPGGLQSMGLQKVRHDWVTKHIHKRKELSLGELAN